MIHLRSYSDSCSDPCQEDPVTDPCQDPCPDRCEEPCQEDPVPNPAQIPPRIPPQIPSWELGFGSFWQVPATESQIHSGTHFGSFWDPFWDPLPERFPTEMLRFNIGRIGAPGRTIWSPYCDPIKDRPQPPFSRTGKKENPKTLSWGKKNECCAVDQMKCRTSPMCLER